MDLWIRSQNKEVLSKCNCLGLEEQTGGKYLILNYDGSEFYQYLGTYDYERALEVLDEIQQHIEKQGENYLLSDENGIITGQKYYGYIYQMPID